MFDGNKAGYYEFLKFGRIVRATRNSSPPT